MEAPKTPKDSSTPKHGATTRSKSREESQPVGEEREAVPGFVQLVPLTVQPISPPLTDLVPEDEDDMRERPLYSPSFNPDDLFAFPFPYVPPLSREALDKRLQTSRAQSQTDAYQRLFRDLIRPGQPEYEDLNVPCGSCPCCQRMLSYVSSLRTVLDHMVSDIVQKSPAGTRVAPCALCLQEHREHFSHSEEDGASQTRSSESRSQSLQHQYGDVSSTTPRQPKPGVPRRSRDESRGHRQSQDGEQVVARRSSEGHGYVGEPHKDGRLEPEAGRQTGEQSANEARPQNQGGDQRREETASSQWTSSTHSTQASVPHHHSGEPQNPNEGRSETLGENLVLEPTSESSVRQNEDPTRNEAPGKHSQRPAPFVQPLSATLATTTPTSTSAAHQNGSSTHTRDTTENENDGRWREARAQLLEPPALSPRDNRSPVISQGGQFIHESSNVDPNRPRNEAYVTMATDNLTALCCLVLGNSLRLAETTRKLAVIVTDGVSGLLRHYLQCLFDVVQGVGVMDSQGSTKLALLEQPELGVSFTKLYVWSLDQFTKCVFLDPDTMVVQNSDELFEREELSAVPDIGWPDCFNSGVFVYAPSQDTFWRLIHFAEQQESFDGGDQGLLNIFFRNWACDISRKLPFLYNLMANVSYTYKPAFKHFGSRVKIVHFFGSYKPWNVQFNPKTGQMAPGSNVHPTYAQFVHFWLEIYTKRVLPMFSKEILDHMFSQDYACPHEILQFIPSPVRQQESLPTPPSFRVYSGDRPREQPSIVDSILQLGHDIRSPDEPEAEKSHENVSCDTPTTSEEEGKSEDKQPEPEDPTIIPGSEFDDYQNMAAWEQGRMDYMGDAKSDTIMKRLDFLIQGKR